MTMFVMCPSCHSRHYSVELEVTGIEEGPVGEDIIEFECPETHEQTKATVYRIR